MAVFMGRYTHNLDQKNRLAIPAKFREDLGETFVLYKPHNGDRCLTVYAQQTWNDMLDDIVKKSADAEDAKWKYRMIGTNAIPVDADKQGRFTIPPEYMEFAGFRREILVLGTIRHLELWDPQEYERALDAHLHSGTDTTFELTM